MRERWLRALEREEAWLYLAPFALFLAFRIPLLSCLPYGDYAVVATVPLGQAGRLSCHPILLEVFLRLAYLLFGWNSLPWVPFLFNAGVFGLVVPVARRYLTYPETLAALGLLAASPWSNSASSQLYIDGSIFTFFLMALLHFYQRLADGGRRLDLVCCGLSFGCLWMSKYSALVAAAGLGLHSALTRGFSKTVQEFGVIFIVGAALFSLYPLLCRGHSSYSSGKILLLMESLLGHAGRAERARPALGAYLASYAKMLIFMGPLLIWAPWRAVAAPELRRELGLPLLLCASYAAAIFFLLQPHNVIQYWSPLAPIFCIVAAKVMGHDFGPSSRRGVWPWTGVCVLVLAGLTALGPREVVAIHPHLHLSREALFRFLPIRLFLGPNPTLYLKPAALLFGFAAFFGLILASRFAPGLRAPALAAGLAYGLFYSAEYSYAALSPDIDHAARAALASLRRGGFPRPVYAHGLAAAACAAQGIDVVVFTYYPGAMDTVVERVSRTGGTLVFMDASSVGPDDPLRMFLRGGAVLRETLGDRGVALAEIWEIPGQRKKS